MGDIDFLSLVTPSISFDPAIAAAASGSGAELTVNRDLIPLELIYSRIDELPEEVLDHVAWGFHVDGYELATTVRQKRYLIKNFYDFHRYKGTLYGHRIHWRALLGLEILKADPPSKSYVGVTMTAAERTAFESRHPEVRVYPFRHSGIKGSLFCGDCLGDPDEGYAVHQAQTDALLRIGDRVTLFDPLLGAETDLNSFQYSPEYVTQKQTDTIEIHKRGTVFGAAFVGECLHGSAADTGASGRLYTLRLVSESSTEIERRTPLSIQPSLEPFRTTYDVTLEPGSAGAGFFLRNRYLDSYPDKGGSFIGQHFPLNTDAEQRVYKRLKLFDPSRVTFQGARKMTFLGGFRIGAQLPHTARIAIDMISRKIKGAQYVAGYLRGRCLCRTDAETRIEQMRYVGILAKRLSDKISMQIHNRFQVKASSGLAVGSKQCGQYQLEVI